MKKVLIVEDEETNSKILSFHVKSFFEQIGLENFKIDVAENGYEAFGMHYTYHYDLILLDVKMPKCDGLKFLSLIRQNKTTIFQPMICMVTALGEEGYINLFRQKGANAFLIKPYDKEKVFLILEYAFKIKIQTTQDGDTKIVEATEDDDGFEFDFDFDDDDGFISDDDANSLEEANKQHINVPAEEFLKDYDNLEYILEDIEDIDLILDLLINSMDEETIDSSLANIDECLRKYATFLNSLSSFGELSSSISLINKTVQTCDFNKFDSKKKFYIIEIIRSILEDLQNWKEFVFIQKTAQDVYYINASVLSNCLQLQNMMK